MGEDNKASRQLYRLSLAWNKFSHREEKRNRETIDETSGATD